MDEIKDLIKIVADHTKKNVPLLDLKNQRQNGNKEMNLFLGIKNGEFSDEAEASNGIYGTGEVDFKFRMLKSRLSKKLLNHLFFMDFDENDFSISANFQQEALHYLHFSKMLMQAGEKKISTKMLHKALEVAKSCDFTGIVIDCLKALRKIYAESYRPKLFRSTKAELEKYQAQQQIEEKVDAIFQENQLGINSAISNRKRDLQPIEKALRQLERLKRHNSSYNVLEQYIKLKICYLELKGDFKAVLSFVKRTENDYNKGKINQKRFDRLILLYTKSNAFIKLKRFREGSKFLDQMLRQTDESSPAWFVFAEKLVLLHMQNQQFSESSKILLKVANNKAFTDLGESAMLRWDIYRAYLYYLTQNQKLTTSFDYEQFIEKTPKFQKVNASYNVAILILQVLAHSTGELSTLFDKLNALDDYVGKYLNNSYSKRTKTFCKLLSKIAIYNRNHDVIVWKSRYLREKLSESRVAGESFLDFEIVSYEYLWEFVMGQIIEFKQP